MREEQLTKMTQWAMPYLEPGESLRLAVWGPDSGVRFVLTGMARGRIVAITERNVYVFGSSAWGRMSKATSLLARHARGSVSVRVRGWGIRVGGERVVVHLHHRNRARELSAIANAITDVRATA